MTRFEKCLLLRLWYHAGKSPKARVARRQICRTARVARRRAGVISPSKMAPSSLNASRRATPGPLRGARYARRRATHRLQGGTRAWILIRNPACAFQDGRRPPTVPVCTTKECRRDLPRRSQFRALANANEGLFGCPGIRPFVSHFEASEDKFKVKQNIRYPLRSRT